ncbi:hypothetical protein HOE04_04860 [archaeon]|jgi:hypothetical protein|nr:hypothetical protein [Candidatus Woesearchaeota archaeon]MBT4166342.1 hypothetical protein [archaeon]
MKKVQYKNHLTWLIGLLSVGLVSAESNFEAATKKLASGTSNIFSGLQLSPSNFTLILFGILLWMVVYSVIRNIDLFKSNHGIWSAAFALIVSILAFNGFPPGFIEGIVIQYQAMGATIVTVIPFIIMVWFTTMSGINLMMSRLIWLVYTVYYFSLFVYKIGSADASIGIFAAENLPYIAAIIMGIIVLIFLGAIRAWAFKEKLDSKKEKAENKVKKAGAGLDAAAGVVDEFSDGGGI